MAGDRAYELVLFGATGFTGALTARYLARTAPSDLRWALAGRDRAKLEKLRAGLATDNPALGDLPLLLADVNDQASIHRIATAARVVMTTVGPYIRYGEQLVAGCAEAGTDYCDLTGESEFVDLMYLRHHARARETGARLVHSCGFDSIPPDLGAYFTVGHLPEGVPIRLEGFLRARGRPSGGTVASGIAMVSRFPQVVRTARRRRTVEPRRDGRKARTIRSGPRYERAVGSWVVPLPTIDRDVVRRSAEALDRYGPDFSYGHYFAVDQPGEAVRAAASIGANLLRRRLRPGEGPTPEQRAKSWFKLRFVGEGGGTRVVTEVSGGDPGYGETSKMLAEAGLCLARDDLLACAGQVTPAVAMGDALILRLQRAGIAFTVLEQTGVG
jgi:short subunit dehydrogenase-like uncharacterized protein